MWWSCLENFELKLNNRCDFWKKIQLFSLYSPPERSLELWMAGTLFFCNSSAGLVLFFYFFSFFVLCSELCPLPFNSYVEALTLSTSEWGCIWRQGFWRGNLVTMGLLGRVLIRDWCPYKKRRLGRRQHRLRDNHVGRLGRCPSAEKKAWPQEKTALPTP